MKTFLKNAGLFFASPFVALAYIIALPFVGMYMFVNLSIEKLDKEMKEAGKNVHTKTHHVA